VASRIAERRDRKITKTNQQKYHKRPYSGTVFWQWYNNKSVLDQQVLDCL